MLLKDQTAIVTGGGRGIGKACALKLASLGANIVINYAGNDATANETAKECEKYGVNVKVVKANVANEEDCERLIKEALEINGRLDILVNNAGITKDNIMLSMKTDEFDDVINTNLRGTFLCMKKALRPMLKQKYGRIISLSSVVGLRGNVGQANYSASKAGILGLTKSMAKEMAARNITVNAVAPGFIGTEMTDAMTDAAKEKMISEIPCKRIGKPEDVANAVCFFAMPDSSYLTGQVLAVDGGMAV